VTAAPAVVATLLVASPQAAHAQWWNQDQWYAHGSFTDFNYYAPIDGYYNTNLNGPDWNWWWS
jgi:hypothetical protein